METLTLFYTDHPGQFIWKLLPSSKQITRTIHLETFTLFYTDHPGQFIWKLLPSFKQIIQENSFGNSYPLLYRSSRTIQNSYFLYVDNPGQFIWKLILLPYRSSSEDNSSNQIILNNSFKNSFPLLNRSSRTIHLERLLLL